MAPSGYLTTASNCKCRTNNTTCACSSGTWYYEFYPTETKAQEIVIPVVKIKHKFAKTVHVNFNSRWNILLNNRNKMLKSVRKGNR